MSICFLGKERSLDEARALFLTARITEALTALSRNGSGESVLLRARSLIRIGEATRALAVLQRAGPLNAPLVQVGEHRLLLATALDSAGRANDAREHFGAAEEIAGRVGGALAAEVAFRRAHAAYLVHDLDGAARIAGAGCTIAPLPGDLHAWPFTAVRAKLLELRGMVAASRGEYGRQAALLVEAWNAIALASDDERDVWVQASVLRSLAPLVWDLHLVEEADLLWRAQSAVAWTDDVAPARYAVNRALAWKAALEGNHVAAFAGFRECADLATTVPWRIASTLDRAYLAAEMRQNIILREEMLRAGNFARGVRWETVVGEEATVLLEIAEAHARDDAALARHWLSRYDGERTVADRALAPASDDRRRVAMEQDAQAAVLAAEGFVRDAATVRRAALATWDDLDHGWRAARSAVALARLTNLPSDVKTAALRAREFRRSWLGRRARSICARAGTGFAPNQN